jgi:hypothetical protein
MGLGKNSGASGDFKPHPADTVLSNTAVAEALSWTNLDARWCRPLWVDATGVSELVRLKPTVAAHPRNRGQRVETSGQGGNRKRIAFPTF